MTTTSTARSTSLAAAASATLFSVALSSTNNSTGRPRRPPRSLTSSITILGDVDVGNSHEGQGAGVIGDDADSCRTVDGGHGRTASRPVEAEQPRGLGLAGSSSFLENRRDLGIGDELRPPRLVPVEQRPDAVLLGWIAEHRRTLRTVQGTLVGGLRAEHI